MQVGPRVRLFRPGNQVHARPHHDRIGTFADFIALKEEDVALKPESLTMEAAASIPLAGLTAWQVLVERAQLKPGQKVLIHAASGPACVGDEGRPHDLLVTIWRFRP